MFYGYVRCSTQTQTEKYGLQMQKDAIIEYCNKNGIELSSIYEDAGISGTEPNRPALCELLTVIQNDDVIIVLQTSRLWRNDTVKVLVHHEVKKAKANIISLDQPNYNIYSKDANDILFNGMLELLDQYERLTIAKRLSKGRKAKATGGVKPAGNCPFAYKYDGDKNVVIDYNNHLIVQDIFTMYSKCRNLSEVARLCTENGYKTSTGKDFSKQAIKNMLTNDFYTGILTYAGTKTPGTHHAIISKELFEAVQ